MCRDCYDYERAVIFNAGAGRLWRRFLIGCGAPVPGGRGSAEPGTGRASGAAERRGP